MELKTFSWKHLNELIEEIIIDNLELVLINWSSNSIGRYYETPYQYV